MLNKGSILFYSTVSILGNKFLSLLGAGLFDLALDKVVVFGSLLRRCLNALKLIVSH
jgi:hypothetical protein